MTCALKRITFSDLEEILPSVVEAEKKGIATFQQKLWQPGRIKIHTSLGSDDVPFKLKNPWSEKDFLRRIEEYLESKQQYLSNIQRLEMVYFCRYRLIGTLYQQREQQTQTDNTFLAL